MKPDKHGHLTCCKVRGFTLNYRVSQLVNFKSICEIIKNTDTQKTIIVEEPNSLIVEERNSIIVEEPNSIIVEEPNSITWDRN